MKSRWFFSIFFKLFTIFRLHGFKMNFEYSLEHKFYADLSFRKKKITSFVNLWSYLKLPKSSIFTVVYWVLSHQTTSRYKFTECEKKISEKRIISHFLSLSFSFAIHQKHAMVRRRKKKLTNYSRRTWKYSMISTLSCSVCCIHPSIERLAMHYRVCELWLDGTQQTISRKLLSRHIYT